MTKRLTSTDRSSMSSDATGKAVRKVAGGGKKYDGTIVPIAGSRMVTGRGFKLADGEDKGTVTVTFKAGSRYELYDVPLAVYQGWESTESQGSYYHANLRDKYTTKQV